MTFDANKPKITFNELLSNSSSWHIRPGGVEIYFADDVVDRMPEPSILLTQAQLDEYHPYLYAAVHALVAKGEGRCGRQGVSSTLVMLSVKEWTAPFSLTNLDGSVHAILSIEAIKVNFESHKALITAQQYAVSLYDTGSGVIKLASPPARDWILVSIDYLNNQFPGSITRYNTAKSLDLDDIAIARYVFDNSAQQASLSLPDLSLSF